MSAEREWDVECNARQEFPKREAMGWLCLHGGGFCPEVLGKHCSLALHQHRDFGGVCWAKMPCSICPTVSYIRKGLSACVFSLAGKRQSGLQVNTDLEIKYMYLCICNCPARILPIRKWSIKSRIVFQQRPEGQASVCHTNPGRKRIPPICCVNLARACCAHSNKHNCCAVWVTRDQWHAGPCFWKGQNVLC